MNEIYTARPPPPPPQVIRNIWITEVRLFFFEMIVQIPIEFERSNCKWKLWQCEKARRETLNSNRCLLIWRLLWHCITEKKPTLQQILAGVWIKLRLFVASSVLMTNYILCFINSSWGFEKPFFSEWCDSPAQGLVHLVKYIAMDTKWIGLTHWERRPHYIYS